MVLPCLRRKRFIANAPLSTKGSPVFSHLGRVRKHVPNREVASLRVSPGYAVANLGCVTGRNYPQLERTVTNLRRITGVILNDAILREARHRVECGGWGIVNIVEYDVADYEILVARIHTGYDVQPVDLGGGLAICARISDAPLLVSRCLTALFAKRSLLWVRATSRAGDVKQTPAADNFHFVPPDFYNASDDGLHTVRRTECRAIHPTSRLSRWWSRKSS